MAQLEVSRACLDAGRGTAGAQIPALVGSRRTDPEAPASNPGPPTNFVFRIDNSGRNQTAADDGRVTNFPENVAMGLRSVA